MNQEPATPEGTAPTRTALIGAGAIGRAWALVFAQAGHRVTLWDPDQAVSTDAISFVREKLADLAQYGLQQLPPEPIIARITIANTLADAVQGADHVQENGPERLETRRELFAKLDQLAPATAILASSTSGMPSSSFTEGLAGRDRCLVAHPANPPYLLPLVELCPAPWTSEATMQRTGDLMRAAGRAVAVLEREVEGFVLNRLQGALLAEAFRLVADGIVSPEDVDTVVKSGLGLRWSFMGPLETIDLNAPGGIADFCARYGGLYERLQTQMPPRAWDDAVVDQMQTSRRAALPLTGIEQRQAWRDRRLMALAAHRATQSDYLEDYSS